VSSGQPDNSSVRGGATVVRRPPSVRRPHPRPVAPVTFLPLPDIELQRLSDDDLIAYVRGAHGAGELAAGRRALALLVFGYERDVRRRLSLRVPAHVIEDVAHDALVRAIAAAFDGTSVGEFRSWLHTIVDRAAVDFFRRAERRPKESILPSEHAGQEDVWGAEPSIDSEAGAVELRLIVEEVLETFNEKHRLVIDLHVFGGLTVATALAKWGVEVLVVDGRRRARYASGGNALRPWATSGAAPSSKARSPGIRTSRSRALRAARQDTAEGTGAAATFRRAR
jgi:RNA polymerase sigma factor (sigma-70 family)